jgi:hypothetical protein
MISIPLRETFQIPCMPGNAAGSLIPAAVSLSAALAVAATAAVSFCWEGAAGASCARGRETDICATSNTSINRRDALKPDCLLLIIIPLSYSMMLALLLQFARRSKDVKRVCPLRFSIWRRADVFLGRARHVRFI